MLEIRKGTAVRHYENSFFREFSKNLKHLFDKYSRDGVLIGNSICEHQTNLQIDALLITERVVCIIDFKNYTGRIRLPNHSNDEFLFGEWKNEENKAIDGGSVRNPFIQLKNQKERLIRVIDNHIKDKILVPDQINPHHILRVVCFQRPIELIGKIPAKEELNFLIVDSNSYLEKLWDVIDVADEYVRLSQSSFTLFKDLFRASPYSITEDYTDQEIQVESQMEINVENLYPDQKAILSRVQAFIESREDRIFIVDGTSLSGKSYLLPYFQELAFKKERSQVEFFATSSRIAQNLISSNNLKFNSIYSYIYGGNPEEISNYNDEGKEVEEEDSLFEIVPLKHCDDADDAIYIVDEAQLLTDNFYQSSDLRFGTGRLLSDYLSFMDLIKSKRKVIFIGDSFQVTVGKKEETCLNPKYLKEHYSLNVQFDRLTDKSGRSQIVDQALIAVNSIRANRYNSLGMEFSEAVENISNAEILNLFKKNIASDSAFHTLTYSNFDALKVNQWIKKEILKNGHDLAPMDLLLFSNNVRIENEEDPFSEPKKIFNGEFGWVKSVHADTIKEVVTPKGSDPITLVFREIEVLMKDSGSCINVLSFENFRLSEKAELSNDEVLGIKILLSRELTNELRSHPFEKSIFYEELIKSAEYVTLQKELEELKIKESQNERVKGRKEKVEILIRKILRGAERKHRKNLERRLNKSPSSNYYKFKNAVMVRFGWALTVHKSVSYKWDEVFFNVNQGDTRGKTNEDYYRWMYTGLTRAKEKISLIKYEPITPYIKIEFNEISTMGSPPKEIFFAAIPNRPKISIEPKILMALELNDGDAALIQLYQFLSTRLAQHQFTISSRKFSNWLEKYEISGAKGEKTKLEFSYNSKGQFKKPRYISETHEGFGNAIIQCLIGDFEVFDFSFIEDDWRKHAYETIQKILMGEDTSIKSILASSFNDNLLISNSEAKLSVDMHYDGHGFFTSIVAKYYDDPKIWSSFKGVLMRLKSG